MNIHSIIKLEATDLAIGQSKRIVCPFCKAEHETSMSITREANCILYNCYRVTCKKQGKIRTAAQTAEIVKEAKQFVPNPLTAHTTLVPPRILQWFYDKYQIDLRATGTPRIVPTQNRIAIPLRAYDRTTYGLWTKKLPDGILHPHVKASGPKTIMHLEKEAPLLYFPNHHTNSKQVVWVEDPLSAEKYASIGIDSVALLGTHLTQDEVYYLAGVLEGKDIVIHLDPDARAVARKMAKKHSLLFKSIRVIDSPRDPKDMSKWDLARGLRNGEKSA